MIVQNALPYFQKATGIRQRVWRSMAQAGFCTKARAPRRRDRIFEKKQSAFVRPPNPYFNIGLANYYLKQYRESEQLIARRSSSTLQRPRMHITHWVLLYRNQGNPTKKFNRTSSAEAKIGLRGRTIARSKIHSIEKVWGSSRGFKQLALLKPGDAARKTISVKLTKV